MRPSELLDIHKEAIRSIVTENRGLNPRVFGSVVHGNDTNDSDLDLLVDVLPGTTLFDLGGLQVELEYLLGIPVDLQTPGDLPLKFRAQVLVEAKPL